MKARSGLACSPRLPDGIPPLPGPGPSTSSFPHHHQSKRVFLSVSSRVQVVLDQLTTTNIPLQSDQAECLGTWARGGSPVSIDPEVICLVEYQSSSGGPLMLVFRFIIVRRTGHRQPFLIRVYPLITALLGKVLIT